jgi:alpha-methylacyl-CoA racemase
LLDGGAHFYDTYRCADGKYVAIGAIEPQFYAELLQKIGIDDPEFQRQMDATQWPQLKRKLAERFESKTRDEWTQILEGSDACFAPVLDMNEAPLHGHNRARQTFVEIDGVVQPAPAPRFSRTPPEVARTSASDRENTETSLREWGFSEQQVARLKLEGVV